jgi:hypothetical protein
MELVCQFIGIKDIRKVATKQEAEAALKKIENEFIPAHARTNNGIFLFVYYSGHGEMTQGLFKKKEKVYSLPGWFVSCNFGDELLNLEQSLRNLAQYSNTCTIGVLECCRNAKVRSKDSSKTGNFQFIFGCREG